MLHSLKCLGLNHSPPPRNVSPVLNAGSQNIQLSSHCMQLKCHAESKVLTQQKQCCCRWPHRKAPQTKPSAHPASSYPGGSLLHEEPYRKGQSLLLQAIRSGRISRDYLATTGSSQLRQVLRCHPYHCHHHHVISPLPHPWQGVPGCTRQNPSDLRRGVAQWRGHAAQTRGLLTRVVTDKWQHRVVSCEAALTLSHLSLLSLLERTSLQAQHLPINTWRGSRDIWKLGWCYPEPLTLRQAVANP